MHLAEAELALARRTQVPAAIASSLRTRAAAAGGEEAVALLREARWRELQLVDTNSRGQWRYRYAFTLEPGTRWSFPSDRGTQRQLPIHKPRKPHDPRRCALLIPAP